MFVVQQTVQDALWKVHVKKNWDMESTARMRLL
jgi:hypothetical protein